MFAGDPNSMLSKNLTKRNYQAIKKLSAIDHRSFGDPAHMLS